MQELTIRLTAAACGLASVRMLMFICSVLGHAALAVFLTHGMQPATAGICRRMDRCSVAIHASRN